MKDLVKSVNTAKVSCRGKKIETAHGNWFIQLIEIIAGREETTFFFLKPDLTRYVTVQEIERGELTDWPFWVKAKHRWGKPVLSLSDDELAQAIMIKNEINKSFSFGFSPEQQTRYRVILDAKIKALRNATKVCK